MPKYQDPTTGFVQEVGDPSLNPSLVQGKTLVPDTTINSSALAGTPSLNLPVKTSETNYSGILASLTSLLNPVTTSAETQQTELQKRILDLTKSVGEKEQYQAQQNQLYGVTEKNNELDNINRQINALNLQASVIPQQTEKDFTGRASIGQQNAISRELIRDNTIKALGLSAQGQLIQGNIAHAKALADEAVKAKFADKEIELKYLQAAYSMNKDILERHDKKRADALKIQLDERDRLLTNQKDNFKIAQGYAFTAMKNNPGNQAAALAAQEALNLDPSDPNYLSKVFSYVGQYQSDPAVARKELDAHLKAQQDILESQAKVARAPLEREKLQAEIGKLKAERNKLNTEANIGGGNTPIGIIDSQTGRAENILQGVPAGTAQIVRNLVDYKIPLPSGFALRSPYWQNILSLASQYDPTFDATQYNVRLKLKQDFTSGKSAANLRSLNTVIGHINTLQQRADALDNASLQLWNRIANETLTQTGDKRVVEFNSAANAVENELATLFKGTGGTDQEIKAWREGISAIQSPDQLKGALNTILELTASRAQALQSQYETGLGKPLDFHFLTDKSRQILTKIGANVDQFDPIKSLDKTTSGTLAPKEGDTKVYNGTTYKVVNGVWTPQ